MTINRPKDFPGTPEEIAANRETHAFFDGFDPEEGARCAVCDCRPGGTVAQWPCGQEPPREIIHFDGTCAV